MALKLVKAKPALAIPLPTATVPLGPALSTKADLIDAAGEAIAECEKIEAKIKALQEKLKPQKDRLAAITKHLDTIGVPDASVKELGQHYEVTAGPRANKREFNPEKLERLLELVDEDCFKAILKIGVTDLDKYCTPAQVEELVTKGYGSRSKVEIRPRG